MSTEKQELLVMGIMGCLIALILCALGIWLFYAASRGTSYGLTLFGLTIEGKLLAATVCWFGLVVLLFSIRKMVMCLSKNSLKENWKR